PQPREIVALPPPLGLVMQFEDVVPGRQDRTRGHQRRLLVDLPGDALPRARPHRRTVAPRVESDQPWHEERPRQEGRDRVEARARPALAPELAAEGAMHEIRRRAVARQAEPQDGSAGAVLDPLLGLHDGAGLFGALLSKRTGVEPLEYPQRRALGFTHRLHVEPESVFEGVLALEGTVQHVV